LNGKKERTQKIVGRGVGRGHPRQVFEPQRQVAQGKKRIEHDKKNHHQANKAPPTHPNEPLVGVVAVRPAPPADVEIAIGPDCALGAAREFFTQAGVEGCHAAKMGLGRRPSGGAISQIRQLNEKITWLNGEGTVVNCAQVTFTTHKFLLNFNGLVTVVSPTNQVGQRINTAEY